MNTGTMAQIQVRTTKENHDWLKCEAGVQERSVNWLVNKVLTDARLAAQSRHVAS